VVISFTIWNWISNPRQSRGLSNFEILRFRLRGGFFIVAESVGQWYIIKLTGGQFESR
jgi:hypothetical protein